jgi:hypothetical protein
LYKNCIDLNYKTEGEGFEPTSSTLEEDILPLNYPSKSRKLFFYGS